MTGSLRWQCLAIVFLVLPWSAASRAQPEPERLITVRAGTIPVILSAPHGGRKAIPDVPVRKGDGVSRFTTVRDEYTEELAEKLAAALEKKLGKPFVVIAHFERKYVDANRPDRDGYESDRAKPYHDAYHKALKDACKQVQEKWRGGVLVDLHGQAADPEAIFRGTADGKSVTHLTDGFGKPALTGPRSILGVLARKGYKIIPANDSADREDKRFNGGYTIRTYGSGEGGTIDAIQLELGLKLRQPKQAEKTASDIADALVVFSREYLSLEPLPRP